MFIKELSAKTGLSKDTIRFYEKKGLIKLEKQHRLPNNYKNYPEEMVGVLIFIKRAKTFGFTLDEIKMWLEDWKGGKVSLDQKITIFEQRVTLVNEKITELQLLKKSLKDKLGEYQQLLIEKENR